jgi:hypothetical protein
MKHPPPFPEAMKTLFWILAALLLSHYWYRQHGPRHGLARVMDWMLETLGTLATIVTDWLIN